MLVHPTTHLGEAVWSSRQGKEGRREGSQAPQTAALGRAAVQEEISKDEGSRGRQGWARLYHCSGLYSVLSHFFCSVMKRCFTGLPPAALQRVCVLSSWGVSIPNKSDAAQDWEELVLQGDRHWDV